MPRWIGIGGRFVNMNYVRCFQIEKKGDLYNVVALIDCTVNKDHLNWEVVATCTTEEQAFGYVVFFLGNDLVNAEGGHPSLRKVSDTYSPE